MLIDEGTWKMNEITITPCCTAKWTNQLNRQYLHRKFLAHLCSTNQNFVGKIQFSIHFINFFVQQLLFVQKTFGTCCIFCISNRQLSLLIYSRLQETLGTLLDYKRVAFCCTVPIDEMGSWTAGSYKLFRVLLFAYQSLYRYLFNLTLPSVYIDIHMYLTYISRRPFNLLKAHGWWNSFFYLSNLSCKNYVCI